MTTKVKARAQPAARRAVPMTRREMEAAVRGYLAGCAHVAKRDAAICRARAATHGYGFEAQREEAERCADEIEEAARG